MAGSPYVDLGAIPTQAEQQTASHLQVDGSSPEEESDNEISEESEGEEESEKSESEIELESQDKKTDSRPEKIQSEVKMMEQKESKIEQLTVETPRTTRSRQALLNKVIEDTEVSNNEIKETPKEARHSCPLCEKIYSSVYNVKRHIKKLHKTNPDKFEIKPVVDSDTEPDIQSEIPNKVESTSKSNF